MTTLLKSSGTELFSAAISASVNFADSFVQRPIAALRLAWLSGSNSPARRTKNSSVTEG
jgi:hypothetical protein